LAGLIGSVLRLPGRVLRLLGVAARLLGLLAGIDRLVLSHLDPVADPVNVLTDVLAGRQLRQDAGILLAPALVLLVGWVL
jgi:hypothetical protein